MSKRKHTNISRDDQWDDSALIDSWDAAVEEYKVSIIGPLHYVLEILQLTVQSSIITAYTHAERTSSLS